MLYDLLVLANLMLVVTIFWFFINNQLVLKRHHINISPLTISIQTKFHVVYRLKVQLSFKAFYDVTIYFKFVS